MIDTRPLYREYIADALECAVVMAQWAQIFLERGDDDRAEAAMRPMVKFVKLAAGEMNTLLAENRQRDEDARGRKLPPLLPDGHSPLTRVSTQVGPKAQEATA